MTRDFLPLNRRQAMQTAATSLALACGAARAQSTDPASVMIVGPWEISGLAPASSGHVFSRLQITETLLGAHDDGSPAPALAERWTVSPDGLEWRFFLRPAARFHDGTPVTVAAVLTCLQAARKPPSLLAQAPIAALQAEGARTVLIRLSTRHAGLLARLAHSSTMVLAPSSFDASGKVVAIVGSGPYRIEALRPPQSVAAVAFDGYDGARPAIEAVRYLAVGRSETRALMAESGQADLAYGLDPISLTRLARRGQLQIEAVTLPRTAVIKVNAGLPALRDPRARQALSLAIDRVGIAKALLRDGELAATQLFPPSLALWHDPGLPPLHHDPEAAARLLHAAGWRRGAGGLRDGAGQPLRLSLRSYIDRPELPVIATALQEQWRQAGIAVEVLIGNSGDIPRTHRDGTLELALMARNYGSVPDPTMGLLQDFAPEGSDWGAMGWRDARMAQALAELARGGAAPERTTALRREVTAALQHGLPVIPVAWYRQQVTVGPRLSGVSLDALERSYRLSAMEWKKK